jgi:hypothetical protein
MGELPLPRTRHRRLPPDRARQVAEQLGQRLHLPLRVRLQQVSRWQVTDERGRPGSSLVGVVREGCEACIYHTRRLTVEDIAHELLHVRHPEWDEELVVDATRQLLDRLHD